MTCPTSKLGYASKQTPKMELIITLDKAAELLKEKLTPLNWALVSRSVDHARAVALRVGHEMRRPKKAKVTA